MFFAAIIQPLAPGARISDVNRQNRSDVIPIHHRQQSIHRFRVVACHNHDVDVPIPERHARSERGQRVNVQLAVRLPRQRQLAQQYDDADGR